MSQKNTGSFTQVLRTWSANAATANGSTLATPTNTVLLLPAWADGSDIWNIKAIATATQTSANNVNLYDSPDGGTTFNVLPFQASFAAGAAAGTVASFLATTDLPLGPTNPLTVEGKTGAFTHTMSQSALTESTSWFVGQIETGGTANAQTLANAYNTAGTQLGASPATGSTLDFYAGVSNTTAATIAPGAQSATSIKRASGTALSANDLLIHNRYRANFDGTQWILLLTHRIYIGVSQSQGVQVTAFGADR